MPLYDTLVKSLTAKFQGKSLYVDINGESMGSDFSVNLVSGNHLIRPIVIDKLDIKSNHVNLDKFIDSLTQIPTPNTVNRLVDIQPSTNNANAIIPSFNISDFQIKNGTLSANEIAIRDLSANNYSSNFSLGEDILLPKEKEVKKEIVKDNEKPKINIDTESKVIGDNIISDDEFFDDFFDDEDE